MRQKIIIFIACFSLAIGVSSAKSLVLTLENGKRVYYLLGEDSNPMLRFINGKIVVDADEYEFSGIKHFYISSTDDPNGIEQTLKGENVVYDKGVVMVDTDKPMMVKVYSISGHEVKLRSQQVDDKTFVYLNSLPQGAYIITAGEISLKIYKK